jgi:hypothetical protein
MTEPDEFTIPRPRWIIPLAIAGVVVLFIGLVIGRLARLDDDQPTPARTGTPPAVVVTTTAAAATVTTTR